MNNVISNYFKEIFKNDVGIADPNVKKFGLIDILYWFIGLSISLLIPVCIVYLEAWAFNINVFKLIFTGYKRGLYRGGYFFLSILSNIFFLIVGFLTTHKINGSIMLLDCKKTARFFWFITFPLAITCFIITLVI